MSNREKQDLVDSYLLNQITPENKARLLDMMEADPVFAQYVQECRETFHVLKAARDRELRKKLKDWDAGDSQSGRRKGILFLACLVALGAGFWYWLNHHYSDTTLAAHSFDAINQQDVSPALKNSFLENWQEGVKSFHQKDFEKALLLFASIAEKDTTSITYGAQWNMLLCQLALNGPSDLWHDTLISFSKNAPEPYQGEALKLLKVMASPMYNKIYRGTWRKTVTSVRPKII